MHGERWVPIEKVIVRYSLSLNTVSTHDSICQLLMNTLAKNDNSIQALQNYTQREIDRIVKECGRVFMHDDDAQGVRHTDVFATELSTYDVLVEGEDVDAVRIMERRKPARAPILREEDIAYLTKSITDSLDRIGAYTFVVAAAFVQWVIQAAVAYEAWIGELHDYAYERREAKRHKSEAKRVAALARKSQEQAVVRAAVTPAATPAPIQAPVVIPVVVPVRPVKELSLTRSVLRALRRDLFDFSTPIDKR